MNNTGATKYRCERMCSRR